MRRREPPPPAVGDAVPEVLRSSCVEDWVDVDRETPPATWLDLGAAWIWYQVQARSRMRAAQARWLEVHGIAADDWRRRDELGLDAGSPLWRTSPYAELRS